MTAEAYEGTWVELSNLDVVDGDSDEFTVTDGTNTLTVETYNHGVSITPTAGLSITALEGIVRYRFGEYRLSLTYYN